MKAQTLLFSAVLALATSAALAQDIDRRMLQHADIVVMPPDAAHKATALERITQACGPHAQPRVPFTEEELGWFVQFGSKSQGHTALVCKAFHDRLST